LTKIVPTNEPSGINAYAPEFPNIEISSRSLLSKLYPKPKLLTVQVKFLSFLKFSNAVKWPPAGSTLGQPSVRRNTAEILPTAC